MADQETKVDMTPFPDGTIPKTERKESRPPAYSETERPDELILTKPRFWRKRIVVLYLLLLVAVGAAAIYFAVSSAKYQSKLKQHILINGHPNGYANVVERGVGVEGEEANLATQGDVSSFPVFIEYDDDSKAGWTIPAGPRLSVQGRSEGDSVDDNAVGQSADDKLNDNDSLILQIWGSILAGAMKTCSYEERSISGAKFTEMDVSKASEIAKNLKTARYFSSPDPSILDGKGMTNMMSMVKCISGNILLNKNTPIAIDGTMDAYTPEDDEDIVVDHTVADDSTEEKTDEVEEETEKKPGELGLTTHRGILPFIMPSPEHQMRPHVMPHPHPFDPIEPIALPAISMPNQDADMPSSDGDEDDDEDWPMFLASPAFRAAPQLDSEDLDSGLDSEDDGNNSNLRMMAPNPRLRIRQGEPVFQTQHISDDEMADEPEAVPNHDDTQQEEQAVPIADPPVDLPKSFHRMLFMGPVAEQLPE